MRAILAVAAICALLAFLFTTFEPWVPSREPVTAHQVQTARGLFSQVRMSRKTGKPVDVTVGQGELAAVSALVSQGFAPNRLSVQLKDGHLSALGSRPFGFLWLNMRADVVGPDEAEGFPQIRLTIGRVTLPAGTSRFLVEQFLKTQATDLPALDKIVPAFHVQKDMVGAKVMLPPASAFKSELTRNGQAPDAAAVAKIYCALVQQQDAKPETSFSRQLQRAVKASEPDGKGHAAALVALSMLVVDPRSADLLGGDPPDVSSCPSPVIYTVLQGRHDWAMHWSLSSALAVTTNSQFARAVGEWKELADSTSGNAMLAKGDPSGFSLADIAADRAGVLTAQKLTDPASVAAARKWVLKADDDQILPQELIQFGDGLTEKEMAERFGDTDSKEYADQIRKIDKVLKKSI